MSKRVVLLRCALLSTVAVINSACSSIDRLKAIGEQPPLSAMDNPTTKPGYKPVQMPMPTPQPATYNPNSLWRNGSRAFFKDQRAHQVGDILTVKVNINDTVTIVYQAPGLMLTLSGQAQEAGALGDTIGVLNVESKRIVQGVISAPDRITVAAAANRVVENTLKSASNPNVGAE